MDAMGASRNEIVEQVSVKCGCSPRTIYNDFETRASWQPTLSSAVKPEDVQLKIAVRLDWIYRQASLRWHSSQNECVKLGALNLMLKSTLAMSEALVLPDLMYRLRDLERRAAKGVFVK